MDNILVISKFDVVLVFYLYTHDSKLVSVSFQSFEVLRDYWL